MPDKLSNYNTQMFYSYIKKNLIQTDQSSTTFINDRDKLIDFLDLSKEEWLNTYNYVTEEEYDNTVKEICKKLKFNNYEDYVGDGKELKTIVLSVILAEKILSLM